MKLLAIDGNSIMNRAFYGIKMLSNKNGVYTNALTGFMNIYLKICAEQKPDGVACAFDLRAPTFRHKADSSYKANRHGMPDELAMQIKEAFEQKKVPFWVESFTNQQFVILSDEQKKTLAEKYYFEEMGREKDGTVVRFCTSWATKQEEVDALVLDISKLV